MGINTMKIKLLTALALALPLAGAKAIVFTTKTNLGPSDTANTGRNIVANH